MCNVMLYFDYTTTQTLQLALVPMEQLSIIICLDDSTEWLILSVADMWTPSVLLLGWCVPALVDKWVLVGLVDGQLFKVSL